MISSSPCTLQPRWSYFVGPVILNMSARGQIFFSLCQLKWFTIVYNNLISYKNGWYNYLTVNSEWGRPDTKNGTNSARLTKSKQNPFWAPLLQRYRYFFLTTTRKIKFPDGKNRKELRKKRRAKWVTHFRSSVLRFF